MKYLRLLPFCLSVLALPLVLTGCKPADEKTSSTTDSDTNTAPATPEATSAPAPAAVSTNVAPAPAAADTNAAPAATTNAPAGT